MRVFIYQADLLCGDCGEAIREALNNEGKAPKDPQDEYTYDSDEYPKGSYPDGGGEHDTPQHCGSGDHCLNALELNDGHKVGCWLENDLTSDGETYVREAMVEGGEVAALWSEWYSLMN